MSINEDRNCNCNNDNNMTQDTMYTNNSVTMMDDDRRVDCDNRREMIEEIRSLEFAITELALYLDTHPEDQRALCLHRKYCKQSKELKDKYQKVYGPLTINYPCNKWRWLEEPWPWERGNF